jgi:Flavin-binding monooxygenase-like
LTLALPDTGECQLIADGKIKLKSGSEIESFTENGILFEDGTVLEADVAVFATGYIFTFLVRMIHLQCFSSLGGSFKDSIRQVCGDIVASECKQIWELDKEGEISGVWRGLGVRGLWYTVGGL